MVHFICHFYAKRLKISTFENFYVIKKSTFEKFYAKLNILVKGPKKNSTFLRFHAKKGLHLSDFTLKRVHF